MPRVARGRAPLPLCRVKSALPVLMALAGSVSTPPAARLTAWLAPEVSDDTVSALASRTLTAPPAASDTVPKSLPAVVRLMLPLAALKLAVPASVRVPPVWAMLPLPAWKLEVPATVTAPPVWVMPPLLAFALNAPLALTLWPMVSPVAAARLTLAPDNAPAVASVPPLMRLRWALPVLMALAGSVSTPPAERFTAWLAPDVSNDTVSALVSTTLTGPPAVSATVLKLLASWVRVIPPLAALKLAVPASVRVPPVWAMLPLPAWKLEVPATVTAPPVWVMPPLLAFALNAPLALTLWPMVSPVAPDSATFAPVRAPGVLRVPPLRSVRSPVPVLMGPEGRVRLPPAVRLRD